jgi:hypothetical protein
MLSDRYRAELDDAIFRDGEVHGRVTTSMSILTDSLLMLNALELYYQKPASKAIAPAEIDELRRNIDTVKDLLREILRPPVEPDSGSVS